MSERVKIVDSFNGYEGPTFPDQETAQEELEKRQREFYAHPGNHNAHFCQTIVPTAYTWNWNQHRNQFVWH